MAKQKATKNSFELLADAQESLLDKFTESLKDRKTGRKLRSRKQYKHVINALSVDDAFNSSMTKNFMELLLKLLATEGFNEKSKIENIINTLEGTVDKEENYDWNANGKKSYKTYIKTFIKFLKGFINNKDERKEFKERYKSLKMDAADSAAFRGINNGKLYLHNILFTKFKSRLRCQDRTSGQKIWLPLRFIAKLYSKPVRGKTDPRFSEWLDSLVNDICIHYKDEKGISHVKFGEKENLSLLLKKTNATDNKYKVYVRWSEENDTIIEHLVYTPTGRGNEKVAMEVEKISDIAIDHVKPIDQTLKEKANNLNELQTVSEFYKVLLLQEGKDPTNNDAKSLLHNKKKKLDLDKLITDLKTIGNDSPLRLMSSEYNSNKSNGDTFKEIRQDKNGNYFGILLEEIKGDNNDNDGPFILYQKLSENGIMRIRKDEIEGTKVNSERYIDIIDFI